MAAVNGRVPAGSPVGELEVRCATGRRRAGGHGAYAPDRGRRPVVAAGDVLRWSSCGSWRPSYRVGCRP